MDKAPGKHWQRYLLTGVITIIPLWITWLIFRFFFVQLQQFGRPGARAMTQLVEKWLPSLADFLIHPWVQGALAIVLTLVLLYTLGWLANLVVGRRLLGWFDRLVHRIPLVQTIYGSIKKLMVVIQEKPRDVQRVVLIAFPTPEMKTVGFVTRVLKDEATGEDLAAVYVPTTPNPTSGYLEIVPLKNVISTDWTVDQAVSFIISGGAVAPETIRFRNPAAVPDTNGAAEIDKT
ncbi:MAG: DUF502 domain-containing protein [Wenzhouxiangellaceae bacterium]